MLDTRSVTLWGQARKSGKRDSQSFWSRGKGTSFKRKHSRILYRSSNVRLAAASSQIGSSWLITGGSNEEGVLDSSEIFTDGDFEEGPVLPVPMEHHCQVEVKLKLFSNNFPKKTFLKRLP